MQSTVLTLEADGELALRDLPVRERASDETLLRVERVGVCGSDVHMWQHELDVGYPVVPGHEFVGVIEQRGGEMTTDSARQPIETGDAVTVVPGISCGDCWYCDNMTSRPLSCNHRDVHGFRNVDQPPRLHGGMSQYFLLEDRAHFYKVPDALPVQFGALVEPLSVATRAVERSFPPGVPTVREGFGIGHSVVVQGAGPIGLLTMAAASAVGAGEVIAVDMLDDRLDMAERFGATNSINLEEFTDDSFIERIAELTPSGDGPDVVIEAVGHPTAFEQALAIPRNGGTVVEVGHYFSAGTVPIDPSHIIHKELDIYGSLAYPPEQFMRSISMLQQTKDRFPYGDLLDEPVPLDAAETAFSTQAAGDAYRATIDPWA